MLYKVVYFLYILLKLLYKDFRFRYISSIIKKCPPSVVTLGIPQWGPLLGSQPSRKLGLGDPCEAKASRGAHLWRGRHAGMVGEMLAAFSCGCWMMLVELLT